MTDMIFELEEQPGQNARMKVVGVGGGGGNAVGGHVFMDAGELGDRRRGIDQLLSLTRSANDRYAFQSTQGAGYFLFKG